MDQAPIRQRLASGRTAYAGWCMLGSPLAVEMVASAGWDLVVIDRQHGAGGNQELLAQLTAARAGNIPAVVRVAVNDPGLIGRVLDAGAHGVICPMVNTAEDARRFIDAAKYPPLGGRSYGPYRASLMLKGDYFENANGWTIACAQIETAEGIENLDEILATPGLDAILAGPNDLAISMLGRRDIDDPAVIDAIDIVLAKVTAANVITWIFANDAAYARPLIKKGWQIVTIGTDLGWLSTGAAAALKSSQA